MPLPRVLRGFLAASAFFTFLCLGTEAVCHWWLHWGTPYSFPVLRVFYTGDHKLILLPDFHQFIGIFAAFHSRDFFSGVSRLSYPAPAVVVYKLFLIPQPHRFHATGTLLRYGMAILVSSWILLLFWWRALVRRGLSRSSASLLVAGSYVFSFGIWFETMQGNIEWVIWIVLSIAVWAFCQSHFKTAAILIGIAASMKFYPLLYVGLFLPVRRYREIALTLATAVISTVVSLWLICPDIPYSWHQTLLGLSNFKQESVIAIDAPVVGFDHSLFAPLKLLLTAMFGITGPRTLLGFYVAALGILGLVLFFKRIRYLPITNQVLCLSIAALLLPPISLDYTLLHLYAGFVLLSLVALQAANTTPGRSIRGLGTAFLLFAFVLSPQSELIWHAHRYAGQLRSLALLGLGYVSLRYPFSLPDATVPRTRAIVSR